VLPHLHARDVTVTYVSSAPLPRLREYKRRMGWRFPWVSAFAFNADFGFSQTAEQAVAMAAPMTEAGVPPILDHLARSTGTDVAGYLTEGPGFSAFAREGGTVYHTYSTTARGLEFLMAFYGILDRAPKGRAESDSTQTWIRRHDEYGEGAS
jgi:predicted dithiol-disulfide oxidoreductase (DUF899 family)